MRKKTLFIFGVILWPFVAAAQQDSVSLSTVEVVAPTLARHVGATGEVQTMGKDDLKQLGIDNVADAVKRFAGVCVKDYGGIGGMKTVSIHNLGAHHTALVYDGLAVSNTQAGQVDVGRYDTGNLESLSLSIGDEDNLMLSARQYAAAGTLSLVTERPSFKGSRSWSMRANINGGMFGLMSPSMMYAQKLGLRTVASVYGKFTHADGKYPFTLHNGKLRTREHRYNSDINAWRAEANVYHTFVDSSRLEAKVNYYYSHRGLPGTVILYANPSDERLWDEEFFAQASYHRRLSEVLQLVARFKYTHSWSRYRDWGSQYAHGVRTDVNRQDEYYGSATLGWNIVRGLDFALAEDLSHNVLKNNVYVNISYDVPRPTRWTSITAMALKWRYGRLKLNGNLAYTFVKEHVEVGDAPDDKKRLTPSISLNIRPFRYRQFYVRAMWKNTFRVPTFNDLYYRRLGNINLRPELAREYSLGLTWNTHYKAMKYLSVTVDGYYNDVKDKIVAFPSMYVWRMANYGKAEITGIDLTLGSQVDLAEQWNMKGSASATWQRAVDKTKKSSRTYNNMLPYTPRWSGSGSLVLTTPYLNIGYSVVMQGIRYSMGQKLPEYRMPAFWEHSMTISRDFKLNRCVVHTQIKLENLTNEQYDIIKYHPMPGRQFMATVGVEL